MPEADVEKTGNAGQAGTRSERLDRHWRWWLLLFWLGLAAFMLWDRWARSGGFALGDTDDNMRMMQVRGLLAGQGWYDLEQHRLAGSNIHWSRLVDLPIAGAQAALHAPRSAAATAETDRGRGRAVAADARGDGGGGGDRAAADRAHAPSRSPSPCSPAPARPRACGSRSGSTIMAGSSPCSPGRRPALTDPKRARGGATLGLATALSLAIGLEMLLYLAVAGAHRRC